MVAARVLAAYPGCLGRGVRLGSETSSSGVLKSGNVCWHQNWSGMSPYGSIWLDTAAKMIVRTLHIFFIFKNSLKIKMDLDFLFKNMKFGLKWVEPITTPPDKVFERPGL